VKKLAYFYLKQSQKPFIITFSEPHEWHIGLTAVNNSSGAVEFNYTVRDYGTGKTVLSGRGKCGEAESLKIGRLSYSHGEKKLYLIDWDAEQFSGKNHYLAGNPPFELSWYKDFLNDVYGDWLEETKISGNNE
jgi:beta-mannosidase